MEKSAIKSDFKYSYILCIVRNSYQQNQKSVKQAVTGQNIILIHGIFTSKEIINHLFNNFKDTL